jgi:hypothetical protein
VKQGKWRYEWAMPGRFAHVSAFAWMGRAKVWLLIDFSPLTGPHAVVWPFLKDDKAIPLGLMNWIANANILKAKVRRKRDWTPKFGFYCVSQVKMLLGSPSWALSPEGLWRDLSREGSTIVWEAHGLDESPRPEAGSLSGGADGNGASQAGTGDPGVSLAGHP